MLVGPESLDELSAIRFDTIVVGSGPVGLMLAASLENRGKRTLVLEAGPLHGGRARDSETLVHFDGDVLSGFENARVSQVGGGLALWGGQIGLMHVADVRRSDPESLMSWPLQYQDIYQYLRETLGLLGMGSSKLEARLRSAPHEVSGSCAWNLAIFETAWLPKPKLPKTFWTKLKASRNTIVMHDVCCTGLNYNGAPAIAGVSVETRGGSPRLLYASSVVLAAGAIENARLLLLPTCSPEAAPWHHFTWLGAGFNEHIDATAARISVVNDKEVVRIFDQYVRAGVKYTPKIMWADRRNGRDLGLYGSLVWPNSIRDNIGDLKRLLTQIFRHPQIEAISHLPVAALATATRLAPLVYRYAARRRIGKPASGEVILRVSTEQPIRLASRVYLSTSIRDRYNRPSPVVHWVRGEEEIRAIASFTECVRDWMESSSLARVSVCPLLSARSLEFFDTTDAGLHPAGTTRMSESHRTGVVDAQLKVHGTSNLYVCGSSVFPSSGHINPTLTAMALAVRLAAKLSCEDN